MKPVLVGNGKATDNTAIQTFASYFDDTMDMLLNVQHPNIKAAIALLEEIAKLIPHVIVGIPVA